jgi:hypothetical protein
MAPKLKIMMLSSPNPIKAIVVYSMSNSQANIESKK